FPENCGDGIRHSIAAGYTAVELDIRATKDGVLVLYHDDTAERLSGLNEPVDALSFEELARQPLRLNGNATSSRLTRLDSAIDLCADGQLLYLDLKFTSTGLGDRLARMILDKGAEQRVLVASSDVLLLFHLEYHYPALNTVLEGFDAGEEWTWVFIPRKFKPDLVSSFGAEIDTKQLAWLKAQGLLRWKIAYGVDTASYRDLRDQGITRFIVDEDVGPLR
ncbi:MAG TPA: glycerophosphodiester phosphodiesterase family protein, partial [Flavobacteriales bacterium]